MNFQELMQRMVELDKPVSEESGVEECGMMPTMSSMPPMEDKPQQDTVTMNVSMNGNGAGGIADLMAILRNIEEKGEEDDAIIAIGGDNDDDVSMAQGDIDGDGDHDMDDHDMERDHDMDMDEFANEPGEVYGGIDSVTQTGGDIHSKGGEAPKVNGGGNPLLKIKVEGILEQLTGLYKEVKLR